MSSHLLINDISGTSAMSTSHLLAISTHSFFLFLERQSQGVIQLSNNKPGCAPDLILFAQRLPISVTPALVIYIENDPENMAQPRPMA